MLVCEDDGNGQESDEQIIAGREVFYRQTGQVFGTLQRPFPPLKSGSKPVNLHKLSSASGPPSLFHGRRRIIGLATND